MIDSIKKVYIIIRFRMLFIGSDLISLYIDLKVYLHLIENLPPIRVMRAIENVIIPKPPNWIRIRIIHWPKKVKSFAVSNTIKPVTHTAEVDVKIASTRVIPLVVDHGSLSSNVPVEIKMKKLNKTFCIGDSLVVSFFFI